uniref:Uncharacterized protein n=1 Tax=Glossina austeni TaxID=7395 RepID=A0A1A9UNG0_GLOAU
MPIASPRPMDDTIASPSPPPLEGPKNYYHFNQNDGRFKSSTIEYKLYEVDIPKIAVNKPNNFDKLVKTYSLDPRIFRSPIIINESISQLVRALNNFYRERVLYPDLVFDIFKIDCAGTLIEIMQNLNIYVDAYGVINEQRPGCDTLARSYFNSVAPVNTTYGFIQEMPPSVRQCTPMTTSSCTVPGVRHSSFLDSCKETQLSSSQAYKYSERYQPSSSRHDDTYNNNRNRSYSRSDRHFDSNQHSIKSEYRRGHKRSSLSPPYLPDRSKGSKDFVATPCSSLSSSRPPSPRSYKSHKSSHTSGGQSSSNYSMKSSSQVRPQQAIADDEEESWD